MTQCAGTTQKGDRCKRDAREGSAYCSIHLEQESRPRAQPAAAAAWSKDDLVKVALGSGILAAIVLFRLRR